MENVISAMTTKRLSKSKAKVTVTGLFLWFLLNIFHILAFLNNKMITSAYYKSILEKLIKDGSEKCSWKLLERVLQKDDSAAQCFRYNGAIVIWKLSDTSVSCRVALSDLLIIYVRCHLSVNNIFKMAILTYWKSKSLLFFNDELNSWYNTKTHIIKLNGALYWEM